MLDFPKKRDKSFSLFRKNTKTNKFSYIQIVLKSSMLDSILIMFFLISSYCRILIHIYIHIYIYIYIYIYIKAQEDFHGAFVKLLERYNKCISARGYYFEEDKSFMCGLSIKSAHWKKNLETYLMILVFVPHSPKLQ